MRFAEVTVGAEFRYEGELFVKGEGNVARRANGGAVMFPSETEVELLLRKKSRPKGRLSNQAFPDG